MTPLRARTPPPQSECHCHNNGAMDDTATMVNQPKPTPTYLHHEVYIQPPSDHEGEEASPCADASALAAMLGTGAMQATTGQTTFV